MFPRGLRSLWEGSQPQPSPLPPGLEPGVQLSAFRPRSPDWDHPVAERHQAGSGGSLFTPAPSPSLPGPTPNRVDHAPSSHGPPLSSLVGPAHPAAALASTSRSLGPIPSPLCPVPFSLPGPAHPAAGPARTGLTPSAGGAGNAPSAADYALPNPGPAPLAAGHASSDTAGIAAGSLDPAPRLRAAPLPRLVQYLLEAPALGDVTFVPAFLGTFQTFTGTAAVLGLLGDRLEELGAPSETPDSSELTEAKAALSSLLCFWLDSYPEDFGDPQVPHLTQRLIQLLGPDWEGSGRLQALEDPKEGPPQPHKKEEEEEEEGAVDPLDILRFPARDVAEQLTLMEAELFLLLDPRHCLGSQWSQRAKLGREGSCPSVRATVHQFNQLVGAVFQSCLVATGLPPSQRALILHQWVQVAEECRWLRNFSSLVAIVSALQAGPIHRLRQSWGHISRKSQQSFEELKALCSQQDNFSASRRLLPPDPPMGHQPQDPVGVVPYLGTFLRDLVMLDAAMKDRLEDGSINFEKKRKEFEVLWRLRGLQGHCRGYQLQPHPHIGRWLKGLRPLSDSLSHSLSCEIEPPPDLPSRPPRPALVITHCPELSSVGTPTVAWDQSCVPSQVLITPPQLQVKCLSVSALDKTTPPGSPPSSSPSLQGGGSLSAPLPPPRGHRRSVSCGSAFGGVGGGNVGPPLPQSDCRIIRVRMELDNGSLYKSILVTPQDKTPAVVARALEKQGQDPAAAPHFQLLQLLPQNRELLVPPNANVFYAMSSSSLDFQLRDGREQEEEGGEGGGGGSPKLCHPLTQKGGGQLSGTFPKMKAKGRRITRALF